MTLRLSPAEILSISKSPLLTAFKGYPVARLADVASVTNGCAFPSGGFNVDGKGMPLIRIRDVGGQGISTWYDGTFDNRYLIAEGDVLIGMDGDFRIARWRGPNALLNQRVCRVHVTDTSRLDERFMLLVLPPFLDAIHEHTSSITVKHLSSNTVLDIPIPLPPIAEQRRIVAKIDEYFSHLDAAQASLRLASMRLDALRSLAYESSRTVDGEEVQIIDLISTGRRVGYGVLQPGNDYPGGTLLVRVGDIYGGSLHTEHLKRIDPAIGARFPRTLLRGGEVLLTIVGTIGRAAVVPLSLAGANVARAVAVLPVDEQRVSPMFLSLVLNAPSSRIELNRAAHEVARKTLNLEDVRRFKFVLPDRDEQDATAERILDDLAKYDRIERSIGVADLRSARLREPILSVVLAAEKDRAQPRKHVMEAVTA